MNVSREGSEKHAQNKAFAAHILYHGNTKWATFPTRYKVKDIVDDEDGVTGWVPVAVSDRYNLCLSFAYLVVWFSWNEFFINGWSVPEKIQGNILSTYV